ncbi:hypothetical protein DBO86_23010 [Pseudomonas indoloxydans]|uniref:Uncharacterized protein n=1 Tax=Ectopseudomonas oleovorans TaxID=301 RepID=A0A2T5PGK7_ECTOL|nr:hypothetical protein [Pseudomonas indoloxydans]PTU76869.1 hypothetical protein DBO86_23010 [Pseudomonas indoloxydans]
MSEQVRLNHSADDVDQMRKDWAESFHFDAPADLPGLLDDYDALYAEAEALRVALLEIASANPAERGIEWAKSYASDGLRGAGSELYARWLDTFKEAEALRAENGRLQADRDRANQYANQQALECNKLSTDLEAALGLLLEAAEDIESWGAYASAYFQEKHDLAGCAMKYRIAGTGDQEDGGAEQAAIAAMPITATQAPEVQASGPYASVADALAQRYPKPSLLKDCNVSYSNSSRPLAEQGERQEVWARQCDLDESDPALFVSRERVEESGYTVRLTTATHPGPDVRALAASLYQACGAYDMPERILDALSAAANGEPFTHMIDGLLPCVPPSDQEVRSLVEALEECAASLAWNCFGECRAIHAGPIMPAAMALDTARATLAAHRQAQRQ